MTMADPSRRPTLSRAPPSLLNLYLIPTFVIAAAAAAAPAAFSFPPRLAPPSPPTSALSMSSVARQQRRGKGKARSENMEPLYPTPEDMPPILPRLLVFDLDNTLWTPELYQIRRRSVPKAGRDIWLFDCARAIVSDLATNPAWSGAGTQLAVASRTHKGDWADALLRRFEAAPGISLDELFPHKEIARGSKRRHFESLKERTGVPFGEMLFFDDDMRMNLGEVSQMGVLCCHCPGGITRDLFRASLGKYAEMKARHSDQWMGYALTASDLDVVASPPSGNEPTPIGGGRRARGRVKFYSEKKRFGFVVEDGGSGSGGGDEFFFHESKVADGLTVRTGMMVEFETLEPDSRGRASAAVLSAAGGGDGEDEGSAAAVVNGGGSRVDGGRARARKAGNGIDGANGESMSASSAAAAAVSTDGDTASLPCFSMSQPFASLLLNGVKTIETRNNPMLMDLKPGTKVLLHCGFRDWRDMDAPRVELRKAGYSDEEISKLSALPGGFNKGSVIGVMEVGRTWLMADRERRGPNMQRRVVAMADDMGKYATIIEKARWLRRPVRAKGFPGVRTMEVPRSFLPEDF